MKSTSIAITLRLPADLKDWAETRSIRNHRSMNSEIVAILSAVRDAETHGDGFQHFANPCGIPGIELLSPAKGEVA